jgi:ribosomal protein S1
MEALSIGQVVTVKVISVDAKRGRIALSIKKAIKDN